MQSKLTSFLIGRVVLPIALCLMAAFTSVQTTQITLMSGNGPIGSQDPANQFTLDGGVTWQDAFIIAPHPAYDVIPGTQYINRNPDFSGPDLTATRYRTMFVLPSNFNGPSLTVQIHADNVATIFLNGVQIGQQPFGEIAANFQDPPESFATADPSLFQAGVNTLEFDIFNFSGPTAFDYKAIVSFVPVLQVEIDIKPGSFPNSVNPNSQGVIPVAILTTDTFDATTVNPLSVTFGPDGAAEAHGKGHIEDVDGDGDLDLVLHFRTQATGIQCGDTLGSLTGETFSGQMIQGSDSIKTVGCK